MIDTMIDNAYQSEVNEIKAQLRKCGEAIKYCTTRESGEEIEKEMIELEERLSELERIHTRAHECKER